MNIIFMGTPIFACGILQALIDEKYNVVAVVSREFDTSKLITITITA